MGSHSIVVVMISFSFPGPFEKGVCNLTGFFGERGKQLKPVGVEVKGIPRTVFPAIGPIRVNEVPREVHRFEEALQ